MDTIFQRVGMILTADLEALLAQAEDAEATVTQMVREIGEASRRSLTAAARLAADLKRLGRMREHNLEEADEWAGRALLALQHAREDLAHEAVAREMQLRQAAEGLQPQLDSLSARSIQLHEECEALAGKLKEAQRRARQLAHRRPAEEAQRRLQSLHEHLTPGADLNDFAHLDSHDGRWPAAADAWDALAEEAGTVPVEESPDLHARLAEMRQAVERAKAGPGA